MHIEEMEVPEVAAQAKLALLTRYSCLISTPTVLFAKSLSADYKTLKLGPSYSSARQIYVRRQLL